MRWHLFSIGSHGDVRPFVALAQALLDAGHEVQLAALEPHRGFVEARGIRFASLGPLPSGFVEPRRVPLRVPLRFDGLVGRALFWTGYRQLLPRYLPRLAEHAAGADALVFSGLAFALARLANQRGIPAVSVGLVPHVPTRVHVDPFFARSPLARWPATFRASARLERGLRDRLCAGPLRAWPDPAMASRAQPRVALHLLACSEALVPRPPDWPAEVVVTGPWRLPEEAQAIPAALGAFVDDGPPPIYAGFGSLTPAAARARYRALFGAVVDLGARLVVGADALSFDLPELAGRLGLARERLHVAPSLPHAWLLPRVCAAVHHGGVGTLTAATLAGVPSIVLPLAYDQFFWAQRVERLGLGRGRPRGREPSRAWLREALEHAQTSGVRARARALGRVIANEQGAELAARVLSERASRW